MAIDLNRLLINDDIIDRIAITVAAIKLSTAEEVEESI